MTFYSPDKYQPSTLPAAHEQSKYPRLVQIKFLSFPLFSFASLTKELPLKLKISSRNKFFPPFFFISHLIFKMVERLLSASSKIIEEEEREEKKKKNLVSKSETGTKAVLI